MWPLYMTIRNIRTEVRSKASHQAVVLLALLPSPVKMGVLSAADKRVRQIRNREVLQGVLAHVLRPFLKPGGCRFNALCADGQYRLCYAPLSAWIADYTEYINLMQLWYGNCVWCESSSSEAGNFHDRMAPFRNHALYERLLQDDKVEELTQHGVIPTYNVLWETGAVVGDLPKPDLLHCMQLGILNHLMDWVVSFLHESQHLELFDQL